MPRSCTTSTQDHEDESPTLNSVMEEHAVPGLGSVTHWEGKRESDPESLLTRGLVISLFRGVPDNRRIIPIPA